MNNQDIIIIATEPWDGSVWRRRHHVAWNLARKHRVLFIDPPLTVFSPITANVSFKQLFNLGRLRFRGRNLYTYSPWKIFPASLPFKNIVSWNMISRKIIVNNIKKVIKRIKIDKPILWVYFSEYQYDYYEAFDEKIVVVDWHDKFSASSAPLELGWVKKAMEENKKIEEKLISRADIIFAVSKKLQQELQSKHKNVHLVPNGVDYEYFEKCDYRVQPHFFRKEIKEIKKPVLVFLSMMHYIVDFELLNYIAESRPEWTLLLIGYRNIKVKEDSKLFDILINRENVIYTGKVYKEEIPFYLNIADVCLLAKKKMEFNRYADHPLKLCEYLAAGKPVVAINQDVDYAGKEFMYIAEDKNEFIKAIDKALMEGNSPELMKKRKNIAKENSWQKRTGDMMRIIEKSLEERS